MMEISREKLKELERKAKILDALNAGGVDNWEGYDFSMESIRKENEIEEVISDAMSAIEESLALGAHEPAGRGCGYGFTGDASQEAETILKKCIDDVIAIKSR